MNIQHSSQSDLWYTPQNIVEKSRNVLGHIDLDPASDEYGNARVKARRYFTKEVDGLAQPWSGCIFINPPGGKRGNKSLTGLFWQHLMHTLKNKQLNHAIFLAFSVEAMQSTQKPGYPSICDYLVCVAAKRIHFDSAAPTVKNAPSHSNAIVYVPGYLNNSNKFFSEFSSIGAIMQGKEIAK